MPPPDQIVAQIGRDKTLTLIMGLTACLLATPAPFTNGATTSPAAPDETLDVAGVSKVIRKSPRWIWRHAKRLKFLRRVGRELVASRRDVEKWLSDQKIK